jgi:hypothetical protein
VRLAFRSLVQREVQPCISEIHRLGVANARVMVCRDADREVLALDLPDIDDGRWQVEAERQAMWRSTNVLRRVAGGPCQRIDPGDFRGQHSGLPAASSGHTSHVTSFAQDRVIAGS